MAAVPRRSADRALLLPLLLFNLLTLGVEKAPGFVLLCVPLLGAHPLPVLPECMDALTESLGVGGYAQRIAQSYTPGEDLLGHLLQYAAGFAARQLLQLFSEGPGLGLVACGAQEFGIADFGIGLSVGTVHSDQFSVPERSDHGVVVRGAGEREVVELAGQFAAGCLQYRHGTIDDQLAIVDVLGGIAPQVDDPQDLEGS
jgi:hypothetical protein